MDNKYQVFDKLIEGVQVIDRQWKYFYVNDTVAAQGKSTRSDLLGQTMMQKYPGIENTEVFTRIRTCMEQRSISHMLNEFVFPDGSKGWFELSIQPTEEGVIILSHDITAQKSVEVQLSNKLLEGERMLKQINNQKHQLEEFCQIIAHNLRGPIVNLQLLSDLLMEANDVDEKLVYLEKQKPVVEYLHTIFEELVEATQVRMDRNIEKDEMNLENELQAIIKSLQGEIISFKAKITYDFSAVNKIFYSKNYIKSILFNLISNALKYHSPKRDPEIHLKTYIKDSWICLDVIDNGLGIDLQKNKDQIFKLRKVFHNHPNAKGFGLFITKSQIESLGGHISVESKPDVGTTFKMQLVKLNNGYGEN